MSETVAYPNVGGTARQKELFEAIHDKYYESASDPTAQAYKEKFVFAPVLEMLGPARSVIELASGTGATVGWLKERRPDLHVEGCDISERAAEDFRSLHGTDCHVADLTKPFTLGRQFDAVIVMGGIHHLVADLDMAFANIRGLLRPGGRLIMAEPSADYILNPLRKLWYKIDRNNFDAANEHALSHDRIFRDHGQGFAMRELAYFGGPAYFLLSLNWVLRIPNSTKRRLAPALMKLEHATSKLPGRLPFASFIACWEFAGTN